MRVWLVGLALLAAACGSTSSPLSRDERERLPLDGRQEIFDAENDLIIARNRADLASDQLHNLDTALADLDPIAERNNHRLEASPATAGRVPLLRKVTRAERDYLEARREVALAEVAVAEQEILTAKARVDLVKQRQIVRIGKAPFASLAAYEHAIEEREAGGKEKRSSSLDLRAKAQGLLDRWKLAQAEYATQTGDFDSETWLP